MTEKYIKASECEKYFYEHLDDNGVIGAMNAIDEMQAADVQPVKHGRWTGDEVIQCSNCNFTMNGNAYGKLVHKFFKYCPYCGALMTE